MTSRIAHVSQVRALYKGILKLHRALPLHMQALGDQYVKDEFRLHKEVGPGEAKTFMTEWAKYYLTLAKQLTVKKKTRPIGENFSPELLNCFSDEQVAQLTELHNESTKPSLETFAER